MYPAPNYSPSWPYPDGKNHDDTDLTDGVFAPPSWTYLWSWYGSVGWDGPDYAVITVDLGSDQPISSVKYSTVGRNLPQDPVTWPANIYVLCSADGASYYLVTDMIKDDPPPALPLGDYPIKHIFTSTGLNTHGRYVRFMAFGSLTIYVDEVEVYGGGKGLPYAGNPFPPDQNDIIAALQFTKRINTDIAALTSKASIAGQDITADIDNVKELFNNVNFSTDMIGFKSIIPFDGNPRISAVQRSLIKLNAAILRAEGNSGLVIWNANRWDHLDMYTSPPQGAVIHPISINMMNKERRGGTFNLTNAEDSDKTVTITVNGLEESGNPDFIKVYAVGYVDTTGNILVGDLLQEVPKVAGGYAINIPAGMAQQIWVEFAPKAFSQGPHTGAISITDGAAVNTINVNLLISRYAFSDKLRLSLGAWEYTAGMSKGSGEAWDVNQLNYAAVMKLFNDYQYDSYWTSYEYDTSYITAQDFDQNNKFIPPTNYLKNLGRSGLSYFDLFDYLVLQEHPGKGIYYLNINNPGVTSFAGAEMGTELFDIRIAAWIDAWEEHLRSIGISPDRVAMSISDEPYLLDRQKLVIYWGRAIQGRPMRPEPRIKVWEDMTINKPEDILIKIDDDDMFTCSDILSPGYWSLGRPYYQDQRINHGKMLTFYGVDSPHNVDPYTYGLLNEWGAFKQGATGLNYWLTISGGCNDLNEYIVTKDWNSIVTALYFDDDNPDPLQRVHSGKHWEAMFEGREDYEYLHILSMFIDYMKEKDPANSAMGESETLRQSAIDAVIQGAFGDNYDNVSQSAYSIKWSDPQDRSVADTQRSIIWDKINQLSVTLNVSALHKIKVMAGEGGAISPPGSDYYAPDKFYISAEGESQTFTITPSQGQRIKEVFVDGVSVGAASSYPFNNVTKDHAIYAVFEVDSTPQPPVLASIGDKTATEDQTLQFTVNATGTGTLTYSATNLPAGATFDPANRTFTWMPSYGQAGSYPVTFTVSDGALNASKTININVASGACIITSAVAVGGSISPSGAVSVNHGSVQAFSISCNPGYHVKDILIDNVSAGILSNYIFSNVTANHTISAVFEADIPGSNHTPLIDSIGDITVGDGGNYSVGGGYCAGWRLILTINATDRDGDALTYSAENLPPEASFDPATHTFRWYPMYDQIGDHIITFKVSDGKGGEDSRMAKITVVPDYVNGLPRSWQYTIWGDFTHRGDDDSDGDGMTNLEEYLAHNDPAKNIAYGKPCDFSDTPLYPLTYDQDGSDRWQLTDGFFVKFPCIWGDSRAVAWSYSLSPTIKIDLGTEQPINEVKYFTAAQYKNVWWPQHIYVLTSPDDVHYYYLADMVKDSPPPYLPTVSELPENHVRHTFISNNLNTRGRFVKFVIVASNAFACIEEIQIFKGGTNQPYAGNPYPATDSDIVTNLKFGTRISQDIEMLRSKANSIGLDITADINNVNGLFNNLDLATAMIGFKSVVPFDGNPGISAVQHALLSANAKILQAQGHHGLVAWRNVKWDPLDPYTSPTLSGSIQPISQNMMNNERRGDAFILTNCENNDKTITITASGLEESGNPNLIKLYTVGYVDTTNNILVGDLLQEVSKGAGGYTVNIPAGMTQQLWVEFAPKSLSQGTHTGAVSITDGIATQIVNVNLSISPYAFPEKLTLAMGAWDYTAGMSAGIKPSSIAVNQSNYAAVMKLFNDYQYSSYWDCWYSTAAYYSMSSKKTCYIDASFFNAANEFITPADYFDYFDYWVLQEHPNQPMYYLGVGTSNTDFAGAEMGTPEFDIRVSSWIGAWESHMRSIGMSPDRLAMTIVDEPYTAERQNRAIYWGRAMQGRPMRPEPRIQVWDDITINTPADILVNIAGDDMFTTTDIISPGFWSGGRSYYDEQRIKYGKRVEFYGVDSPHFVDPYAYGLLNEWSAFKYGATCLNYWSTSANGCNDMNEYVTPSREFGSIITSLYFDDPAVHSGKHWEAIFEGREDYEYLRILSMFIDYMKEKNPTNAAIVESETLRQSAINAVLWGAFGNDYADEPQVLAAGWAGTQDRTIADTQRNLIWNKINQLSAALGVTFLHKVKVVAGEGGAISPAGSDYYAPDKFYILAEGESQTFAITPDQGQRIKEVFVDGVSVGAASSYPFNNVTKDHTIYAVFEVDSTPQPPVLASIGDKTASEGQALQFTVNATGMGSLTYSASGLPQGSTFDPANQAFTWTPTYQQAGTYNVTFTVTNGTLSDSKTITIASSFIDTDNNHLPDTWERQHFGAIGQDPNADPDTDGLTNIEEYKSGTDPAVPTQNIALGKSYDLDPMPDDEYDGAKQGGNDMTNLTDGQFVLPWLYMWNTPQCLYWGSYINAAAMTIDLGSDQPISTIKYSTVSLAEQGKFWPHAIYVLASQDNQNYYFITDMMKADPNIPPVPSISAAGGASTHYRITASGLDTHARYVKLIVINTQICTDEVQVFSGGNGVPGSPYVGAVLPGKDAGAIGSAQYDSLITILKWKSRISTDINTLKNKAAAAGPDLTLSLNAIQARAQNFSDYSELSTFKSIIPLPYTAGQDSIGSIQRDLIKLNAQILQAQGNSGLVLWHSNRWDNIDMYTSPSVNSSQSISLDMMNQERRGDVFNVTNANSSDETVSIALNGINEGGNSNFVKLYSVGYVDTNDLTLIADLLQEITNTGSGYMVTVPAGMTQQFWIEFAPSALAAGTYIGNISVGDGLSTKTLDVSLSIGHYTFSSQLAMALSGWEFFDGMYYSNAAGVGSVWNTINTDNYAAIKKIYQDYKIDTYWGGMYSTNAVKAEWFDAQTDKLTKLPSDYFNVFDRWVRAFPDKKMYYLWASDNTGDTFAGVPMTVEDPILGTIVNPSFNARVAAWIDAWTSHLSSPVSAGGLGMSPDRLAIFTNDEPNSDTMQKREIYWGRAIQGRPMRPDPRIQVYTDVTLEGFRIMADVNGESIYDATDILSPGYWGLVTHANDGGRSFPFYNDQVHGHGKALEFYGPYGGHSSDPYASTLLENWDAFRQGATAINTFLAITGRCNNMNEYIINNGGTGGWTSMATPLYLDDNNPDRSQRWHVGKNWQAMFEGREDYEYLHILSMFITYMEEKYPGNIMIIDELKVLRQSAPDAVVWGAYGNNYQNAINSIADIMKWSNSKDRSVADTQRNLIWNKINELSAPEALNVSSLHKIKVTAGQGGAISPSGSDYYAPDKLYILAEGESQTFTVTTDPGYRIQDVIVDGVSQGAIVTFTFDEVNQDHTIMVVFAANAA